MSSGTFPASGTLVWARPDFSVNASERGAAGLSPATIHWMGLIPAESGSRAQTPTVRTSLRNFLRSRALRWGVTLALLAYAVSQLTADQIAEIASWNSVALLLASSLVL
jgi:hypothetical protein